MNLRTHRLIRQLHLWIGAWGALAAILFGISGFMQNHRGIMKLPQGDSTEISNVELEVPESARGSRDAMRAWLHDTQHVDVESQRGREGGRAGGPGGGGRGSGGPGPEGGAGPGGGAGGGASGGGGGAGGGGPGGSGGAAGGGSGPNSSGAGGGGGKRWMFNGGNARVITQVEYTEGASTLSIRKSENSPLAILERLHKGVGGGAAWILLTDSFAVAMVLLGISGIILWARGRTAPQMVFSIVGAAVVVLLLIGGSAVI